jgi:hypothetical protein
VLAIGRQRRGAFEKRRCSGEATASLRSGRGTLELRGDVLVGSGLRLRAVPGAAIGIGVGIGCLRQRAVDLAALLEPGRAVDGRANEGVTEDHARRERQQVFRLDGLCRRLRDPQPFRRPPDERRISDRIGCRHEQQAPRVMRELRQPSREALLDARRQGHRHGQAEASRELGRRQPARQLDQGKRIATRLLEDPVQHVLVQRDRQDGLQQRPRIATTQRLDTQLRQAHERVAQRSCREHQRNLLRQQAAGDERQRARRLAIEPLRVVDDDEERPLLRGLGKQPQDRQSDKERIRWLPGGKPESDGERVVLGLWESLQERDERPTQLLCRTVRELHLRLDPTGPSDAKPPPCLDRVLEQRGLADARLSVHHQDAAVPAACRLEEPVERLALAAASEQMLSRRVNG